MILPPLYMHEGDFMMIFPFYYRTNQGKDHHFVWPLVKVSEGRLTRVAPVWFMADADTFTMLPFFRQTPDYTFWAVPPIYNRHDGKFMAVWPLYAKSQRGDGGMLWIAPSYYNRKGDERTWNLFPLYFSDWSSPKAGRSEYKIPFLFDYMKDETGYDFWLFPFGKCDFKDVPLPGLRRRGEAGKFFSVKEIKLFPVWSHTRKIMKDGDSTFLWLFPGWRETSPRKSCTIVLPLFLNSWVKSEDVERKDFWLLPWVQGSAQGESYPGLMSYHGLPPIYYYSREKQKENLHRDLRLLWPFYRSEITTSPDGKTLDYYNRFLIFSESKSQDGTRVFKLLGIPIVERTK